LTFYRKLVIIESCKFKKVFSKKKLPNYLALLSTEVARSFATFLKISVDKYMAMWYDNRLGSGGASWFDFVKSLPILASDVNLSQ
jgi:hypothetical protein